MIERTLISKMTFYDTITLIVPSSILCCSNGWLPFKDEPSWVGYVALFGVVLMVGLILKGISIAWNAFWFRNSTKMILNAEKDISILRYFASAFVCGPIAYLFSFIYTFFNKKDEETYNRYYNKYENAYKNNYSGKRIELLEAQVAFIQSMIWALVFCLVGIFLDGTPIVKECSCPLEWWGILLLIYACIVVMIILQKKVYKVVFDAKESLTTTNNLRDNTNRSMNSWNRVSEHAAEIALIGIMLFALVSMSLSFLCERPSSNQNCKIMMDSTQIINVKLLNNPYNDIQ